MSTSSRDRINVDLRGLRAALFEQARALETLDGDVRKHLDLSSSVLAELQPRRTASNSEQSLAP
jgi:hypothetical protein